MCLHHCVSHLRSLNSFKSIVALNLHDLLHFCLSNKPFCLKRRANYIYSSHMHTQSLTHDQKTQSLVTENSQVYSHKNPGTGDRPRMLCGLYCERSLALPPTKHRRVDCCTSILCVNVTHGDDCKRPEHLDLESGKLCSKK